LKLKVKKRVARNTCKYLQECEVVCRCVCVHFAGCSKLIPKVIRKKIPNEFE